MNKTNLDKYRKDLKKNKLSPGDYNDLKNVIQEHGKLYKLSDSKKKKQKNTILMLWEKFELEVEYKPLFLSNLYLYDDEEFIMHMEEAIGSQCKASDYPKYIELHYQIKENATLLKLLEFEIYHDYIYNKRIKERIKDILHEAKILIEMPTDKQNVPIFFDNQVIGTKVVDIEAYKEKEYIKTAS